MVVYVSQAYFSISTLVISQSISTAMYREVRSYHTTYHSCAHSPCPLRHMENPAVAAGKDGNRSHRPLLSLVCGFQYLCIVAESKNHNRTKMPPVWELSLTGEEPPRQI